MVVNKLFLLSCVEGAQCRANTRNFLGKKGDRENVLKFYWYAGNPYIYANVESVCAILKISRFLWISHYLENHLLATKKKG